VSQGVTLREAERRAFTGSFQDGLLDIRIGCVAIMFAIAPLLSDAGMGDFWSSMVFLPFWALIWLGVRILRQRVTIPRIGVVEFGPWRKARLSRLTALLVVTNVVVLGLGLGVSQHREPAWSVAPFLLGGGILLFFCSGAYWLDLVRLYWYGGVLALAPLGGEWLYQEFSAPHHGFPITFGFASGVIILSGLFQFVRLMYEVPVPAEEPPMKGA